MRLPIFFSCNFLQVPEKCQKYQMSFFLHARWLSMGISNLRDRNGSYLPGIINLIIAHCTHWTANKGTGLEQSPEPTEHKCPLCRHNPGDVPQTHDRPRVPIYNNPRAQTIQTPQLSPSTRDSDRDRQDSEGKKKIGTHTRTHTHIQKPKPNPEPDSLPEREESCSNPQRLIEVSRVDLPPFRTDPQRHRPHLHHQLFICVTNKDCAAVQRNQVPFFSPQGWACFVIDSGH